MYVCVYSNYSFIYILCLYMYVRVIIIVTLLAASPEIILIQL